MLQVAKLKLETRIHDQLLLCYFIYFILKEFSFLNLTTLIKIFHNVMYYPQTTANLDLKNT